MRSRFTSRVLLALSLSAAVFPARAATLALVNNTLGDNSFDVVGVSNDGTRVAGTASTFVELEQGVAVSYDRPFFW